MIKIPQLAPGLYVGVACTDLIWYFIPEVMTPFLFRKKVVYFPVNFFSIYFIAPTVKSPAFSVWDRRGVVGSTWVMLMKAIMVWRTLESYMSTNFSAWLWEQGRVKTKPLRLKLSLIWQVACCQCSTARCMVTAYIQRQWREVKKKNGPKRVAGVSAAATHVIAGGVWRLVLEIICAFCQLEIERVEVCTPKYILAILCSRQNVIPSGGTATPALELAFVVASIISSHLPACVCERWQVLNMHKILHMTVTANQAPEGHDSTSSSSSSEDHIFP